MVVSDVDDIFVPLPDDLRVNLSESRTVVESFLDSLPSMFQDSMNVESAFGPALKAAYMVMVCWSSTLTICLPIENALFCLSDMALSYYIFPVWNTLLTWPSFTCLQNQLGGKLLIFQNTLPSIGAGRLRLRGDDLKVYGTDKEHSLRVAEDPFYKQMAADFTKYQIGINVYAFSDKYTDIASLGMSYSRANINVHCWHWVFVTYSLIDINVFFLNIAIIGQGTI